MNRYVYVDTMQELYDTVCIPEMHYTIFQSEDMKKASGLFVCRLNPVGGPLVESIITSGVALYFEYRRTIDVTIIKLHESGIINLMKERWIESKNVEAEDEGGAEPINMVEVYLVLCVLAAGWIAAFVVLIFEKLIFRYYNKSETTSLRWNRSTVKSVRQDHKFSLKNIIKQGKKKRKLIRERGTRRSGTLRRWCRKIGLIKNASIRSDNSKRKF
ncbi:glutamate receptor ionotropic, kainate 2-like [Megachile rotundata]|uniref:glutamate receptor ionotropic, kainate 2-like n=1 Tax=Megachile rotundata TaxID=143995 RepID=UPI003FD1EAF6